MRVYSVSILFDILICKREWRIIYIKRNAVPIYIRLSDAQCCQICRGRLDFSLFTCYQTKATSAQDLLC